MSLENRIKTLEQLQAPDPITQLIVERVKQIRAEKGDDTPVPANVDRAEALSMLIQLMPD